MRTILGQYNEAIVYGNILEDKAAQQIEGLMNEEYVACSKIRIMPDVHAGKDIVVGFTVPFTDHVNPDHVGGDIGCSVSTVITDLKVNEADYATIERSIREHVKFGMTIHEKSFYNVKQLYKHL